MYQFWGDYMISMILGLILILSFEAPFIVIEKVIFGNGRTKVDKAS